MTPEIHKIARSLRNYKPDFVSSATIGEILSRFGYNVLGSGMFGAVIDMEDFVLKVFRADDDAYLAFLDFCDEVDSPHLPNILWDAQINEKMWAVCLEKLEPIDTWDNSFQGKLTAHLYREINKYQYKLRDDETYHPKLPLDLRATMELMEEYRKNNDSSFWCDIHDGNVMLRGSTIVITDPWC